MPSRPPRILHPVSSLAGRVALLGLLPHIVSTTESDYNGLEVAVRSHGTTYRTLWYLSDEDPLYWAFRLLDGDGQSFFQSPIILRTREGTAHLVPSQNEIPLFHVTTAPEAVAECIATFDYRLCQPPLSLPKPTPNEVRRFSA